MYPGCNIKSCRWQWCKTNNTCIHDHGTLPKDKIYDKFVPPYETTDFYSTGPRKGKKKTKGPTGIPNNMGTTKVLLGNKDQCFYCERELNPVIRTIDHILPRSRGGTNTQDNRVYACTFCNHHKGPRNLQAWANRLKTSGPKQSTIKQYQNILTNILKLTHWINAVLPLSPKTRENTNT